MSRFHRLCHLKFRSKLNVGQYVEAGKTIIGYVGTTGKSTGPHVHHDGTLGKPKSWHQYHNRPMSEYFNTEPWSKVVMPYGNRYLTSRHGVNGHIGVDINVRPVDDGLPIYSPVNGRVVYVEPPITIYRIISGIRRLIQPTWGRGFGNFMWIEADESRPTVIDGKKL